ncbi:MAG TPA: stimulus-sensing domain-containing protein [Caulobacteraceae bacterium]|jgi:two-component system sensor histidine kinase ChvG|uniref:stimulus-sensing domain-containing protein n=1 Tax=Phenylobacterium sp. TaxID=1871053 RepID=UPI002BAAC292|nr:stimulus-sensing domain-containing protein [Phenylobacterium sp.]HLZ83465.1 stimulus-sensing domain-containing protein [Caulobacteraceae bacterium]HXA38133.1 stimulus-sensing domain-containing protein [Phenylobacterium sp.]
MASATATAKPDRGGGGRGEDSRAPRLSRFRWLPGTRLGRLIIALNFSGLVILIAGALVLNELRQGLVSARIDSLTTQGELMAAIIDQAATVGEPTPAMDPGNASLALQMLANPKAQRARLFDAQGAPIADSDVVADRVEQRTLPPARPRGQNLSLSLRSRPQGAVAEEARAALRSEVSRALLGKHVAGLRRDEDGRRVVSVSIPIQNVQQILGVLTLEANDVDQIIAREREALIPFILIAVAVTLSSSLLLTRLIAQPVRRLARAADRVRLAGARAISLPDLARRDDELGDLTRSLEDMTQALSERMDAIESFAADVAHEIKNPLTSLRSAVETLDLVAEPAARERLLRILKNDVQRLDRLVTDISNASRLDAELSRDNPKPVDLERLVADIVALYQATAKPGEVTVRFARPTGAEPPTVLGREGSLGQVFRNLIDNARSFSPPGGEVEVAVQRAPGRVVATVSDSGPGIPPENLETIFERFYTSRPKGAAFGGNSGLGLSIARQIVEAHGGTLKAQNRVVDGKVIGAVFLLMLPEAKA